VSERRAKEKRCLVLLDGAGSAPGGGRGAAHAFAAAREGVRQEAVHEVPSDKPLPSGVAGRDWQLLIQPRLDVAWMGSDVACLRILELPTTEPSELGPMVELQLEKISPMPAAQAVHGFEVLPGPAGSAGTTVLVAIAARSLVEQRLASLAEKGFVADRLDVPLARELAGRAKEDGLWIVADPGGSAGLLAVAWRVEGRMRHLDVLRVAPGEAGARSLASALTRVAWAAEVEGWLPSIPAVRIVAPETIAQALAPALSEWSGRGVPVVEPVREPAQVAADSARVALARTGLTLVPEDVATRNRQAFVDRLWMRGLGSVGAIYLMAVLGGLAWFTHKESELSDEQVNVRGLAQHYTNAMRLRDQVLILEEQANLRFAALDCWKAAVETLPDELTLTSMNFVRGRTLRLDGTVDPSRRDAVTRYNSELLGVKVRNQSLFASVKPAQVQVRGTMATWSFEADLNRLEAK
jgi:hypothetical protein